MRSQNVTNNAGKLWSWGANYHMQVRIPVNISNIMKLGHYAGLEDVNGADCPSPEPIRKLQDQKIVQLAVGYWHNLAVTDTGSLYAWGIGYHGNLGTGDTYNYTDPQWIIKLKEILVAKASCGVQHSAIISEDGEVQQLKF